VTTLVLKLEDEKVAMLRQEAARLGLVPEDLAKAAVEDLLARPPSDFERAAKHILSKNRELYRRLAR
jgi:antitoxin FitA